MILHPFRPQPGDIPRRFRKVYSPDQTQFRALGWSVRGPRAIRWADAFFALFLMGFIGCVVLSPILGMLALLKWLFT